MTLFLLPFCAGGQPLSAATLYRPSAVTPVLGRRQYRLACRNCAGYKGRISVQSYRPSQRRQRGKRLRIFTTNTFCSSSCTLSDWKVRALTGQAVTQGHCCSDGRPPDSQRPFLQRGYAVESHCDSAASFLDYVPPHRQFHKHGSLYIPQLQQR